MDLLNYFVLCFGTLFAVLSPLATIPPFLAMTVSNTRDDRLYMARRACFVALFVLLAFALTGLVILDFFGITVAAFKIAGGIVLLRASLEMLGGSRSRMAPEEREEAAHKDDVSVTPLAIPLLCGPVTIVTSILLSARATTIMHYAVLFGTIAFIYILTYILLRLAVIYSHLFSEIAMRTVSRLMGLLLASLAVQIVINGIREAEFFAT
jgi:multiple antibiotic resistance protein